MNLSPQYWWKKSSFTLLIIVTLLILLGIAGCKPTEILSVTKKKSPSATPGNPPTTTNTVNAPNKDQSTATKTRIPTRTQLPPPTETTIPTTTFIPATITAFLPLTNYDCVSKGLPENACTGVTTNLEWTPYIQEFNGFPMALVPAGCFTMGNDNGRIEEQPSHEMCIQAPFWIDLTEVTAEQYSWFMNGTDQSVDDLPVWINFAGVRFDQITQENGRWVPVPSDKKRPKEFVNFDKAIELCTWRGGRLLTEAEWEFAARGPDSWLYPWGNDFNPENVVRIYDRNLDAGSKPAGISWVGAFDMSSSLHEWVSSIYRPYPFDPLDGRETPLEMDNQSERVLKGGSWYHSDGITDNLTATGRINVPPWYSTWPFGFRCGLSIDF